MVPGDKGQKICTQILPSQCISGVTGSHRSKQIRPKEQGTVRKLSESDALWRIDPLLE